MMREIKVGKIPPLLHLTFNEKEMVVITEDTINIDFLKKNGWTRISFIGYAQIQKKQGLLQNIIGLTSLVPMYKLTKGRK